jgi:hypothetical protein
MYKFILTLAKQVVKRKEDRIFVTHLQGNEAAEM